LRLWWVEEGVDDWDKAVSFVVGATPRRPTSSLGTAEMAFSQLEAAQIKKLVGAYIKARRPAPAIRPELDLGFHVKGQSVEIFEIRPVWRGKPGEKHEGSVAKATYVRTNDRWRVFWMRRDLKWHRYEPASEVKTIEDFLAVVDKDAYACFWG
jgi:hypothetical protein